MIRTHTIVTALLLSAGCEPASVDPPAAPAADRRAPHVRPAAPAASAVAWPDAVPAPMSDDQAPRELLLLRGVLEATGRDRALASTSRFRPLCDREGYPLVGNVLRKGPRGYQPSEFCADLRAGAGPVHAAAPTGDRS